MIKINKSNFEKIQGKLNNKEFAEKLGIERTTLWRLKNGAGAGAKVISNFKKAFPKENISEYFLL